MSERKVTRLFPRRVWCYSVHRLLLVLYFIRNLEGSRVGPHLCLVLPADLNLILDSTWFFLSQLHIPMNLVLRALWPYC